MVMSSVPIFVNGNEMQFGEDVLVLGWKDVLNGLAACWRGVIKLK